MPTHKRDITYSGPFPFCEYPARRTSGGNAKSRCIIKLLLSLCLLLSANVNAQNKAKVEVAKDTAGNNNQSDVDWGREIFGDSPPSDTSNKCRVIEHMLSDTTFLKQMRICRHNDTVYLIDNYYWFNGCYDFTNKDGVKVIFDRKCTLNLNPWDISDVSSWKEHLFIHSFNSCDDSNFNIGVFWKYNNTGGEVKYFISHDKKIHLVESKIGYY